MYTKFEVSSLSRSTDILGNKKFKMGHVTWPRPFQGRFVICRLKLAMFNPRIKFEMSTITCNEKTKGNAKCKNSRFEPPFGGLRGNARVRLWLYGKCVVDFILVITAILDCGTIKRNCRNRRFQTGVGHFEPKF